MRPPKLAERLHETAKAIALGLLNGSLMNYPPDRMRDLHNAVKIALGEAQLPDPWRATLQAHRRAVEAGRTLDEAGVLQLLREAGGSAQVLEETLYSPDAAPERAYEYAQLVWATQLRALAARLYSEAGAGDLDALQELLDRELPPLLERKHAPANQPALRPRTPAELLSETPSETEWLWFGVIPAQGFTLLAGREKAGGGKSSLLLALLSALARGDAFLGRQTTPRRVLYLSEESRHTVAQKLERFGLDARDGVYFLCREDFPQGTAGALQRHLGDLERMVRELGIEYAVVDTLAAFSQLKGDAENHAGAMLSEVLAPVQRMLGWGVGVLVVHHMARHTGEARGSTALLGATDVNVSIRRLHHAHETSTERVLSWTGRYDTGELVYRYDPETATYALLGNRDEAQRQDTTRAVLDYLRTVGEPQTLSDICDAVGGNRQRVSEALQTLYRANAIQRTGGGRKGDPYLYTFAEIDSDLSPPELESISAKTEPAPCTPETVLDALRETPNATSGDLAQRLGVSERRVRQVLSELIEQGAVRREGSPRGGYHYRFTEIGSSSGGLKPESISAKNDDPDACAHALEAWLAQHTGDGLLQLDADEAQQVREAWAAAQQLAFPALEVPQPDGSTRPVAPSPSAWLNTLQELAFAPSLLGVIRDALQRLRRNESDESRAPRPRGEAYSTPTLFADGTPPAAP